MCDVTLMNAYVVYVRQICEGNMAYTHSYIRTDALHIHSYTKCNTLQHTATHCNTHTNRCVAYPFVYEWINTRMNTYTNGHIYTNGYIYRWIHIQDEWIYYVCICKKYVTYVKETCLVFIRKYKRIRCISIRIRMDTCTNGYISRTNGYIMYVYVHNSHGCTFGCMYMSHM